MEANHSTPRWRIVLGLAALLVALPRAADSASEDDLFLFTTSVAPNVLLLVDNSGSMNHAVWHPAFNPKVDPTCNYYDNAKDYYFNSNLTMTRCGKTFSIYFDPSIASNTRVTGRYLNWLYSPESTPYAADLNSTTNGVESPCLVAQGYPATYPKYRGVSRVQAARRVLRQVICEVNAGGSVRFGIAQFRTGSDPAGGFVTTPIDDYSIAHAAALEKDIQGLEGESWTPLGETLYEVYRYFQSRNKGAFGKDGVPMPVYKWDTTGGTGGTVPPTPVQYSCQKNFVIIITDGEPTKDDFDDPMDWSTFSSRIGDYNPDNATPPENGDDSRTGHNDDIGVGNETALFLDDVAKYMSNNDFQRDFSGDQTIDVYTIGFTTSPYANALLKKTADAGNGLFFSSNNAEELSAAIVGTITDIIEKSQSFTAATVPSTRTADGGDFFTSFFLPSSKRAFWQGHLRSFTIDAVGDIFDANGKCAFIDPDPGECNSGPPVPDAVPFWDAGEQVPASAARTLYTTQIQAGVPQQVAFDDTLKAADLTVSVFAAPPVPAPNPVYPGSGAKNEEGLAQEIVSYVRGCQFGTGVSGADVNADVACTDRLWRLGDIFHSAPAVVGGPTGSLYETSYKTYRANYATRDRVIYAGANDGFLHAFDAGTWNALVIPPRYTKGTGQELFGFMPWEARRNVKNLAIDAADSRHYYVDGSPQVGDAWLYPAPNTAVKAAADWKTVLVGGLRQGGRSYFALDVTDPAAPGYPGFMWEFPNEADTNNPADPDSHLWYLGESWSQPIITRVRVKVDADDNSGQGYERWVAIVSGGYAANGDPNDQASYNPLGRRGRAIVILDLKTGKPLAVKRYDPAALPSDAQSKMVYAIPSTPAVLDLDSDGFADEILVGDLGGQIFKWVIHNVGEDRANDTSPAGDFTQPSWPFKVFFSAPVTTVAGVNYYKSFFFPPSATFVGSTLYIAIGSGERANLSFEGFPAEDENNRFYVIKDPDPYETLAVPLATLSEADPDLALIDVDSTCADVGSRGYYFKLDDGEKIVTNSEIFVGDVFAGSFIPSNTGDPCTSKGNGRLYGFAVDCGTPLWTDASGDPTRGLDIDEGMPTDPQISVGVDGKDNRIYIEKSGADLESIGGKDLNFKNGALLYWREVR